MEILSESSAAELRQDADRPVEVQCCHRRSSSESGRKWRRAAKISYSSHKSCQASCLRAAVMSVLLFRALALLVGPAAASSQIQPVWISSSSRPTEVGAKKISFERASESGRPQEAGERRAWDFFGSEPGRRTRLDEMQLVQESKRQLQAAASSLQPAIVSADVGDQEHEQAQSQARGHSGELPRFRLAHMGPSANFSHEATSLDHLWSGSAGPALNHSLTNAQVQFDEEHPVAQHERVADAASSSLDGHRERRADVPAGGPNELAHNFSRRHDNETHLLSNLAPTHEDYHPILFEDLDIHPAPGQGAHKSAFNKTQYFTDEETLQVHNQSYRNSSNRFDLPPESGEYVNQKPAQDNEKFAPASLYYLPVGWRANNVDNDKKAFEAGHKLDAFERNLNSNLLSHRHQHERPRASTEWQHEQRAAAKARRSSARPSFHLGATPAPNEWLQPASLSYGFSPSHLASSLPATQQHMQLLTTPMPGLYQPSSRPPPPSHDQREQFGGSMTPVGAQGSGLLQLVPLNELGQMRQQMPISRRTPPNKRHRVVKLGEVAPGSRATKSILRNYSPMQLLGGARPTGAKKSILSALNNRLNNWSGEQQLPNVDKMIEQSFFEPARRPVLAPLGTAFAPSLMPAAPTPALFFAAANNVRQPTVAPASSFNRFYGQAGTRLSSGSRQPSLRQRHGPGIQHQGSQQPASFIPVVAVQMTRTSAAPNLKQSHKQEAGPSEQHADSTANEIEEYLANKVGQRPNSINHQLKAIHFDEQEQKWDDSPLSGMSLPSMSSSRTAGQRTRTRAAQSAARWPQMAEEHQHVGPRGNHETTVKSAVFGYLPHQADAPLLQAMQMLQQMPADKQLPAGAHSNPMSLETQELYANQMDRSNQAVDAATPFLNHHSFGPAPLAPISALGDEASPQASLALQLQAHNYVQNDIAHPFGALQPVYAAGGPANSYMAAGSSASYKPLDVYSTADAASQLQFLQATPTQQSLEPTSLAAYQDSWAQLAAMGANPLLSLPTSGPHHQPSSSSSLPATLQQQLANLGALTQDQLVNPSLAAPVFYPLANGVQNVASLEAYLDLLKGQTGKAQHELGQQAATPDEGATDSGNGSDTVEGQISQRQPGQLNQRGKKRSGEFFANAGQLLLSALPLLLAPTLGLMFASAQSPVARYQAPSTVDNSAAHYAAHAPHLALGNELHDGLVLNASPAPQLFTPTPLAGHSSLFENFSQSLDENKNSKFDGSESVATTSSTTTRAPSRSSTTSSSSSSRYKPGNATASLPALTGLKMDIGRGRNKSAKTSPRPMTIILTTPMPVRNASQLDRKSNFSVADLKGSASGELSLSNVRNSSTLSPTILVLEEDEEESNGGPMNGTKQESYAANDTDTNKPADVYHLIAHDQSQEGANLEPSVETRAPTSASGSSSSSTSRAPTILYDIGYEGADFDAQFASLRRVSTSRSPTLGHPHQSGAPTRRPVLYMTTVQPMPYVKDKSRYQYAEVASSEASESASSHLDPQAWNLSASSITRGDVRLVHGSASDRTPPEPTRAPDQESDEKLYPVSTWPTLRRRTVSLITSQGNKTLPDSSERYTAEGLDTRHQAGRERTRQRNRGNKLASILVNSTRDSSREPSRFVQTSSAQLQVDTGRPMKTSAMRDTFMLEVPRDALVETDRRAKSAPHARRRRDISNQLDQKLESVTRKPQLKHKSAKGRPKLKKQTKTADAAEAAATFSYPKHDMRAELSAASGPISNSISVEGSELERAAGPESMRRSEQQQQQQQRFTNTLNQSGADLLEPLRRDASKSKSAIVTAMITHVNSDDEQDREPDEQEERRNLPAASLQDDYEAENGRIVAERNGSLARLLRPRGPPDEESELRDQMLAKKMLLDRIATRASASSNLDGTQNFLDEPVNNLQMGGRGSMRPVPIEDAANFPLSHTIARHPRRRKSNSIELNEATKRALAKFGTLLLEDTLQIPAGEQQQARKRSSQLAKRQRYATPDYEQGSATERYAMRATQAPSPLSPDPPPSSFDNWSRLYDNRSNYSRYELDDGRAPSNYTTGESAYANPARSPSRHSDDNNSQDASSDNYYAARQNRPYYRQSYNESFGGRLSGGGGGGAYADKPLPFGAESGGRATKSTRDESGAMSRYNDFLLNNFHSNRASNSSLEPNSRRGSHSNSAGELDARYSTYSNYSTSAPAYQQDSRYYPNDRYAYPDRSNHEHQSYEQAYPGANYSSAWPRSPNGYSTSGRHSEDPYGSGPPPPPPMPPHYSRGDHYAPSASYNGQSAFFQSFGQHHGSGPSNWPTAGSGPGHHPARFPAPAYQHVEQPMQPAQPPNFGSNHQYQAHFNDHPAPRYPASTTYAPSPASYGPSHHHSTPHEPTRKASDTKAVNEYLKRVQFSDSDRDKLMASYLTCDNLLNDNDHCLERLSCEFSDPQNIEKANKLDRAVSSILLGHILINTYIPNSFKLRLKSASLFGYTQSGKCSKFACSKLTSRLGNLGTIQNE